MKLINYFIKVKANWLKKRARRKWIAKQTFEAWRVNGGYLSWRKCKNEAEFWRNYIFGD
jgi:hypothetical protein